MRISSRMRADNTTLAAGWYGAAASQIFLFTLSSDALLAISDSQLPVACEAVLCVFVLFFIEPKFGFTKQTLPATYYYAMCMYPQSRTDLLVKVSFLPYLPGKT